MITFDVPENDERVIHCPFCGTHNHPDTVGEATNSSGIQGQGILDSLPS